MNPPTLSFGKLDNGCDLQVDRDIDRARNTAESLGLMDGMTEDLREPGVGVRFVVGVGRDGGWLRAIVACATAHDFGSARDIGWMGFAVSPIRHDSRKQLLDLVAATVRRDPKTLRIVYR